MAKKKPAKGNDKHNPSAFKAAAKNAGVNAWKKARKEAPRSFGELIPKGRYTAQLKSVTCSDQDYEKKVGTKTQKIKIPVVRFGFEITSGEYKGANVAKWINLRPEDVEYSEYDYADLSETLQNLGKEIDTTDLSTIPDIAEELTSEQPECMIYCDVNEYTNKKGEKKQNQRVRVNGLLEEGGASAETGGDEPDGDEDGEEIDLEALAASADDDQDEDAQAQLTEIAESYDIDPNDYETWAEVVELIREKASEGEEEQEEEQEEEEEPEAEEEPEEETPARRPVKKKKAVKHPAKKPVKKKK